MCSLLLFPSHPCFSSEVEKCRSKGLERGNKTKAENDYSEKCRTMIKKKLALD
jgi:hypothetical protein